MNNIKTNKDGSKTPTAIKDNYVFQGDADASAPGAPKIIKKPATEKKVKISHSTEWTGFFAKITKRADKIAIKEKK